MGRANGLLAKSLLAALLLAGCASPGAPGAPRGIGEESPGQSGPKQLAAAVLINIPSLAPGATGTVPGSQELRELVNVSLTTTDSRGVLVPRLAEAVPTVENGLWRVFPDGRMETTWKIRRNAQWHDGTPFTSEDPSFTVGFEQDRRLPITPDIGYRSIEGVEAPDARTLTVRWREPYIDADKMFSGSGWGWPRPKHILADPLAAEEVDRFLALPYWTEEFVGTGPYRMQQWVAGSHVVLQAFERYPLGRPQIDVIELKFIPDPGTLIANVLAGAVGLTLGKTVAFEQALEVRDRWTGGRVDMAPASAVLIYPQFIELFANPPLVGNVQLRRALSHAVDRHELVDTLFSGLTEPAHSLLSPADPPYYKAVEGKIVQYPHDPRRATQLIEGLGYARGPDSLLRDGAGQKLSIELRTNVVDVNQKATFAVANYWQRVGVSVDPVVVPTQRSQDREYRATFPAFELLRSGSLDGLPDYHSRHRKSRENNWTGHYTGYASSEYDVLVERYVRTIPRQERIQVVGELLHHMTDEVVVVPLFWDVEPTLVGHRVRHAAARFRSASTVWNAHEWELT